MNELPQSVIRAAMQEALESQKLLFGWAMATGDIHLPPKWKTPPRCVEVLSPGQMVIDAEYTIVDFVETEAR